MTHCKNCSTFYFLRYYKNCLLFLIPSKPAINSKDISKFNEQFRKSLKRQPIREKKLGRRWTISLAYKKRERDIGISQLGSLCLWALIGSMNFQLVLPFEANPEIPSANRKLKFEELIELFQQIYTICRILRKFVQ